MNDDPLTKLVLDVVAYLQLRGHRERVLPREAWEFCNITCCENTIRRRMLKLTQSGHLERISPRKGYRLTNPSAVSRDRLHEIDALLWGKSAPFANARLTA